MTTIYSARKIITMNPSRPEATHVAVRDGRILGAGTLDELAGWGDYTLDDRFADKVIMPGLVEGHCHAMEGTLWKYTYVGFFDRMDPHGKTWDGAKNIEAVIERLQEADAAMDDPDMPLPGWSLDPIYFGKDGENGARVSRADLDRVSTTRPVGVMHASGHILNVNSKALDLAGLLKKGLNNPGLPLGTDGLPTGELKGPDVMTPVGIHVGFDRDMLACDENGLIDFGILCVRAGVTTATDLAARLPEDAVKMMSE
ncbi:MAG: amidohydrolase family protein, partial [Pseudomonadota bacterium]